MSHIDIIAALPEELLDELNKKAEELRRSKDDIIENALRIYLDQLNRSAYLLSYQKMKQDDDILKIAEEGMKEYFQQLNGEGSKKKSDMPI